MTDSEKLSEQMFAAERIVETLRNLGYACRVTVRVEEVRPRGENKWGHDPAELVNDGKNSLVIEQLFAAPTTESHDE